MSSSAFCMRSWRVRAATIVAITTAAVAFQAAPALASTPPAGAVKLFVAPGGLQHLGTDTTTATVCDEATGPDPCQLTFNYAPIFSSDDCPLGCLFTQGTLIYNEVAGEPTTITYERSGAFTGQAGATVDGVGVYVFDGPGTDAAGNPVTVAGWMAFGSDLPNVIGSLAFGDAQDDVLTQAESGAACARGQLTTPTTTGDAACDAVGQMVAASR